MVVMKQHMCIGLVDLVGEGHPSGALVLVQVKQLAGQVIRHQALQVLHSLGYELVQCEQNVAVGACT